MRRLKRLVLVLIILGVAWMWFRGDRLAQPDIATGSYLELTIRGQYVEAPPQDLMLQAFLGAPPRLMELLVAIRKAQVDPRIEGVIARVGSLDVGWGKAQEIRDALLEYKNSGKPLLALLEQEVSGSNLEYYIAAAADRIYLAPGATAPLNGLSARFFFLGGVWDKLDVEMNVEKMREYKTMGDFLGGRGMTEAHREMANSLLDSLDAQFVDAIVRSRDLEPQEVRAIVDDCPVSPQAFETTGLSDGTKYLQTIHEGLGGEQAPLVRMEDYARVDPQTLGLGAGAKIAVVYAVGTVVLGDGGRTMQGEMLGSDTLERALREASSDDDIRAIVLRVDSPGGSALASDLLWQAVRTAGEKKPVIVSMGDVAASGGYYLAAAARKIVAQPGTMTGSIGVVLARPYVRNLLTRLGVETDSVTRGRFAELDNVAAPLTEEGRTRLVAGMEHAYLRFVDRVAVGRGLTREQVDAVGGGRVWTGEQAQAVGLVDELGGFRRAIEAAKEAGGIDVDEEVEVVFFPKAEGILGRLGSLFGARFSGNLPRVWQDLLAAVTVPFPEGTVLALSDAMIEIR